MRKITVNDVAKALDLSQGAVSKALTGKKGVSEATRKKVIETAKSMGYKVNTLAQGLAKKNTKIGVIMPKVWMEYYGGFIKGIENGLRKIDIYKVKIVYQYTEGLYSVEQIKNAMGKLAKDGIDGLILCPGSVTRLDDYSKYYQKNNIPVILLGSDIDICEKVSCIKVNSYLSGQIAADFMNLIVEKDKSIITFVGNKDMDDHSKKLLGFRKGIEDSGRELHSVYETQDDEELAYVLAKNILKEIPDLGGIYIATGNSASTSKAILELGLEKKVKVVATDIFEEIREYVENGVIRGVIYQNPTLQGEIALWNLFKILFERIECEKEIFVEPTLVLKSNFKEYKN